MASASPKVWKDIKESLLTCKTCKKPFNQQDRLPRVLPCRHVFCGPCLAKLDRGGQLSCPNCRREIQVAGTFPVETTRSALLEECLAAHRRVKVTQDHVIVSLEEAARSPSLLLQKVGKCQKHQDEKLEYYCKTCKSAICSKCVVVLHKERHDHDNVELRKMVEQAKRQIESHCGDLDKIRDSILEPRAKMAATSLQETVAAFKAAEQQMEDVFSKAVNALLERRDQALEELRTKCKAVRYRFEDQAADTESMASSAKTSTALGRTVSSVGLPSHIVAQEQELKRAVQEARAQGQKPLQSPPRYQVTTDLSEIMKCLPELGAVKSVAVTSQSTGVPTTRPQTSSTEQNVRQLSGPEMAARMKLGTRVKRGADWDDFENEDEDGPAPGLGRVIWELNKDGLIWVRWDNGSEHCYRMGCLGKYELQLAEP